MRNPKMGTPDWHIHIGAHKTATTHLQETLLAIRPDLLAQGVDVVPVEPLRRRMIAPLGSRLSRGRLWPVPGRALARAWIRHRAAPFLSGGSRVVLSDEVFIGECADLLAASGVYFNLAPRLKTLSLLSEPGRGTFYLSIRSFDRVLPGAYATALRFHRPHPQPMEKVRERVRTTPPSWTDLVSRIRKAVPNVPLRVWRQEDYATDPGRIVSELTGITVDRLPNLPPPAKTVTPSAEGVAKAEAAIAAGLSPETHRDSIEAIYTDHPAGPDSPRYMPFDAEECRIMQEQYARDIDRIRRDFPGMLIEFDRSSSL